MIVVTGGAGFIGSCIVCALNSRKIKDLIVVDDVNPKDSSREGDMLLKKKNLDNKKFKEYFDRDEFLAMVQKGKFPFSVDLVVHMGACSSTTLSDEEYYKKNNFEYSRILADWALQKRIPFIYASSAATYGDGSVGYKDDIETMYKCRPLNFYGQSKQDFDMYAHTHGWLEGIVGLKFFNVFGPNEYHKGDMRSVAAKSYEKVASEGKIRLFKSYKPEYKDGEQKRDFIYVKDAVNVVLFFIDNPKIHGIYNCGTGQARSWNDLAVSLFKAVGKKPSIEYYDMPETLRPRYQYFTQADMSKLRKAGYSKKFTSLEESIADYAGYLKTYACM